MVQLRGGATLDYPVYFASSRPHHLGDGEKILTAPRGRDTINTMETRQRRGKGRKTMYTTIDINGVTYQPINNAERVNVGLPAAAMWELLAYIPAEGADDMGYYNVYALRYNDGDPDAIDWETPADIVPHGGAANQAGYNPQTGRIC